MNTTVVIATYNRGNKVIDALHSLELQDYKDFDVVVVNDGSTDNTKQILDRYALDTPLNIKVLHQLNGGRSKVRNNGAAIAEDGIIIFMDDDMRHNAQAIGLHVQHHQKHKDSILVGNSLEDSALCQTDIQKYRLYLSERWSHKLANLAGPMNRANLHVTAANMSISKKTLNRLGGFDVHLKDSEDYDLGLRAILMGIPVYYNANIIGWHDDFITCRSYIQRKKQYLKSHEVLRKLRPELYGSGYRQATLPTGVKGMIYRLLRGDHWVKLVDSGKLSLLPKKIKYSLYSAIIYSNSI